MKKIAVFFAGLVLMSGMIGCGDSAEVEEAKSLIGQLEQLHSELKNIDVPSEPEKAEEAVDEAPKRLMDIREQFAALQSEYPEVAAEYSDQHNDLSNTVIDELGVLYKEYLQEHDEELDLNFEQELPEL